MLIKIPYETAENRDNIFTTQESKGFRLIEDQIHFDGKFLVFDDGQPVSPPRDLSSEIDALKVRLVTLEKAKAL